MYDDSAKRNDRLPITSENLWPTGLYLICNLALCEGVCGGGGGGRVQTSKRREISRALYM